MNQETILIYVNDIERVLAILKYLAKLTPTTKDDEVASYLTNVVIQLKPMVSEPWFAELLTNVIDVFTNPTANKEKLVAIKDTLATYKK